MAMIGEELLSILGLMPVRDRAGIPRSTMAEEAKKSSAAAASGGGEHDAQQVMRGGPAPMAPPPVALPPMGGPGGPPQGDIQLPPGVPTEYASGKKALGNAPISTAPPPPSERVVAAGPAAAPGPAVASRASDIALEVLERQQQQAKMQHTLSALGLIANSIFNRNPNSQGATRQALAAGLSDGKAGGLSVSDIKTLADMREKEDTSARAAANREQVKQHLMTVNGFSAQQADAIIATEQAGKYMDPDNIKKRDLDTRLAASRAAMLPKVEQWAKEMKTSPEIVRDLIEQGKITEEMSPSKRASVLDTESQTRAREQKTGIEGADYGDRNAARTAPDAMAARLSARLGRKVSPDEVRDAAATEETWKTLITQSTQGGQSEIGAREATTAKTRQDTKLTAADYQDYLDDKGDVDGFSRRYGIDHAAAVRALASPESRKKYLTDRSGSTTTSQQDYDRDLSAAQAQGPAAEAAFKARFPTIADYANTKAKTGPSVAEQLHVDTAKEFRKDYQEKLKPKAEAAKQAIEGQGMIIGDMYSKNLGSGGKLAKPLLEVRKTIARTLGLDISEKDINTEAFFGTLGRNILAREGTMKGALSNADMEFLHSMNGSMETSPQAIARLQHIEEKLHRFDIDAYRERHERDQNDPNIHPDIKTNLRTFTPVEQPKPTKITDDKVKEKPKERGKLSGIDEVKQAIANDLTESKAIRDRFDREYGRGMFKHYVTELRGAAK
jgi:hypothetical protein